MRRFEHVALLAWLAALPSGCDKEVSGFLSCGDEICGPRQECVASDDGAACVCLPGYLGEICDICAFGHRRTLEGECELIPIDCDENPSICGDHGQCTSDAQGDFCSCGPVYVGRLCEGCIEGYQDNDGDATCEPTCARSEVSCESPTRCSDASGTPQCVCPTGYVGETCEQCALGYRDDEGSCVLTCDAAGLTCGAREVCDDSGFEPQCVCSEGYSGPACDGCDSDYVLDQATGACLPSCEIADLDCGEHGQCSESTGFASCECDLAYAGQQCERCAEGYELEPDVCRFTPPATHTLLADVAIFGQSQLVALDPASGDAIAVGEQALGGLAGGPALGSAYAFSEQGVSLLQLLEGERTLLVPNLTAYPALAFDTSRDSLYAIASSAPFSLLVLDADGGTTVPQGDTGLGLVLDLAYDALNDRVLALGQGLSAVDPSTAAVTLLPDPPPATRGIAYAADGTLYALAATDLTPEEARIDACRRSAAGLGLLGYDAAPGSVIEPDPEDATLALDTLQASEAEVVAYFGRAVAGDQRTVTITSDNADAVLCLEIREPTTIDVGEAAVFRALIAFTVQSAVTVDVDDAFIAGAAPAIHLGGIAPTFLAADSPWIREYEPEDWELLRLAVDPRFYAPGPGVLHTLDTTFASTSMVPLPSGMRPFGTLTAWTPSL
jgi:hypothetical protein